MLDSIKLIANGPESALQSLRDDLANVLRNHGLEVTEKGHPRPGHQNQFVMYLTGSPPAIQQQQIEPEYTELETGA